MKQYEDPFAGLDLDLESALIAEAASNAPKISVDQLLACCGMDYLVEGCNIDTILNFLRCMADKIKGEDALLRAGVREAVIAKLQAIGTRSPAALVDAAISLYAPTDPRHEGIAFEEPMPWPEQVKGDDLINDIASVFCRYAVISSNDAVALALWTVLTYLSDTVQTLPLLVITSPEKRCGKTLVLELLQACVLRPVPASNISAASLYRVTEKYRPTLLIDEADSFLGGNEELRGIINSGHRRSSAYVLRCDGDDLEPRRFSTWCPKAIALIGNLADTLEDRSIQIQMQRKTPRDEIQRLRGDRIGKELQVLRQKIARWARDVSAELEKADPHIPSELHDRAQDNWRPLIAIADCAGGIWPSIAREAAVLLSKSQEQKSAGVQLLSDIRSILTEDGITWISSEELRNRLTSIADKPWADWSKGRPISARKIADLLRSFGIKPERSDHREGRHRGYDLTSTAFQDAFNRYIPG